MLIAAPLESARFGLRTYRAELECVDTQALFTALVANGADLVILRVPPAVAPTIHALDVYGLATLHADTLVTYGCDLQRVVSTEVSTEGFSIETAGQEERSAIADLVRHVFAGYPNHYAANPLLAQTDVLEGYCEWALSHLSTKHRSAWVARVQGRIAALACNVFDPTTGHCEGVLHGVDPAFAQRGIYTAMIRHTQQHFKRLGYRRLTIKTQARNLAVQRVWAREGFVLDHVQATVHVNALLDPAHGRPRELPVNFNVAAGTPVLCEIVHHALGDRGAATIRAAMLAEPRAGSVCVLRLRSYALPRGGAKEITVATLHDAAGKLCAIARADTEPGP